MAVTCTIPATDLFNRPFGKAYPLRRPQGDGRTFYGPTHAWTVAWNTRTNVVINPATGGWGDPIWDATTNRTMRTITRGPRGHVGDGLPATVPIPNAMADFGPGTDRGCSIYDGNTKLWHSFWDLRQGTITPNWTAAYYTQNSALQVGITPRFAPSASGIAFAMLALRGYEWSGGRSCQRALGVAVEGFGGGNNDILGTTKVWPALYQDTGFQTNQGPVPYGAWIAMPLPSEGGPTTAAMGLTTAFDLAVYNQLVNYGIVICDQGANVVMGADQFFTNAMITNYKSAMGKCYSHLRFVSNVGANGSDPIGGGTPYTVNCGFDAVDVLPSTHTVNCNFDVNINPLVPVVDTPPLIVNKYNFFLYNQMRGGSSAIDFDAGGIKIALVSSSYVPDITNHSYFSDIIGEVSGTNYTAGGIALTGIAVTLNTTTTDVIFDANDVTWTFSPTGFDNARYGIIYRSSGVPTTSVLIAYVDLSNDMGNSLSDLVLSWDPKGIIRWYGDATTVISLPNVDSVAVWENKYSLAGDLTFFGPYSTSADSNDYYTLGLSIDGNTAMYRATGDTTYLDRSLLYINRMINDATTQAGGYLGWLSSADGNTEQPLREFYCWRYVCLTLDAMKPLTGTYDTQYTSILAFTEQNIWKKWYSRGLTNLYRSVVHICAHAAFIAWFLRTNAIDATIRSQAATVQDQIDNVGMAAWNGSSIRSVMQAHPLDSTAYFWKMYFPKVSGGGTAPGIPQSDIDWGSDAPHGAGTLAYLTEMAYRGYGNWTNADMQKFVVTWNKFVWPSAAVHYNYLMGAGPWTPTPPSPTEAGNYNDGPVKLGKYNVALQKRFETYTVASNAQLFGNGALNARILLGGQIRLMGAITVKYYNFLYNQMLGSPVNLTLDTIKVALVTNTYVPNNTTHIYFNNITNEVTGANYIAGGSVLSNISVALLNGKTILYADNVTWNQSATGFANARHAIIYKSTGVAATSPLIAHVDFDTDIGNTINNCIIVWDGNGIISWDDNVTASPPPPPPPPTTHTVNCNFDVNVALPPTGPSFFRWGIRIADDTAGTPYTGAATLHAGHRIRSAFNWAGVATSMTDTSYTWGGHDANMNEANRLGLKVLANVGHPPGGGNPYPAGHVADFARFCTDFANHFKNNPALEVMEFFNEPDLAGWTGAQVAEVANAASHAVKAVAPKIKTAVGVTATTPYKHLHQPLSWFYAFYDGIRGNTDIDIITWHEYCRDGHTPEDGDIAGGPTVNQIQQSLNIIQTHANFTGPIMDTEWGWPTSFVGARSKDWTPEAHSAPYMVRYAVIHMAFPQLRAGGLYVFQLYGASTPGLEEGGMGLTRGPNDQGGTGSTSLGPAGSHKPGYDAWVTMINILDQDLVSVTAVTQANNLWRYRYDKTNGRWGYVFWTVNDDSTASLTLTALPATVRKTTMTGTQSSVATSSGSLTLTVTMNPTWIDVVW